MRQNIAYLIGILVLLGGCGGSGGGGSAADTLADGGSGADGAGQDADAGGGADSAGKDGAADAGVDAGHDGTGDTGKDAADAAATCKLPDEGVCKGSVVSWCSEDGEELSYDCADLAGACTKIDDEWGYDCRYPAGTACIEFDDDGVPYQLFCAGQGPGCALTKDDINGACGSGMPACLAEQTDTCVDGRLLIDCNSAQGMWLDCKSLGGACVAGTDDATGKCTGLAKGSACEPGFMDCASGLTCKPGASEEDWGSCD